MARVERSDHAHLVDGHHVLGARHRQDLGQHGLDGVPIFIERHHAEHPAQICPGLEQLLGDDHTQFPWQCPRVVQSFHTVPRRTLDVRQVLCHVVEQHQGLHALTSQALRQDHVLRALVVGAELMSTQVLPHRSSRSEQCNREADGTLVEDRQHLFVREVLPVLVVALAHHVPRASVLDASTRRVGDGRLQPQHRQLVDRLLWQEALLEEVLDPPSLVVGAHVLGDDHESIIRVRDRVEDLRVTQHPVAGLELEGSLHRSDIAEELGVIAACGREGLGVFGDEGECLRGRRAQPSPLVFFGLLLGGLGQHSDVQGTTISGGLQGFGDDRHDVLRGQCCISRTAYMPPRKPRDGI